MKIDRRSFLSFVIGGAAGTALSPIPAKLTDDLSIWTQNWPWTPVPKDGEVSYANSVCTLCPGGCGISVRKVEDRAVKIEGREGYPGSDGNACALCLSGLQLLYGPTRVRTPLKKVDGKWKKISWDDAISEVTEKLKGLRESDQAHTVACISGSERGTVPQLFKRLLTAYGSPNFMSVPSMQDSYALTLKLMHGVDAAVGFDLENANFVLSFGSGILEGWGSSVRMFKAHSGWKDKKTKVVQIDPRLSNTAAKADQWLPAKPGTEMILAMGLAHVIIRESLYNKAFVEKHAAGFDTFSKMVKAYPPKAVAEKTGIDADVIVTLAKEFAGASNPLAICGRGQGEMPGSLHEFMAVHALNALKGNINQKGGVWAVTEPNYIAWPAPELDDIAAKGTEAARVDGAGSEAYLLAKSLLNRLPEAINAAEESPVQALFVSGANPCYTMADTQTVKKAFDKIPFVVSFSSYMDETAEAADLILPNHSYLERYEDVPSPVGAVAPMIGLAAPVMEPRLDTQHSGDVVIQIAKSLGDTIAAAFPWDTYQACLEETLGDHWEALNENGFVAPETSAPAWNKAFATASKKFEFVSEACKGKPGQEITGGVPEGDAEKYPFLLIPYDSMRLANDAIGNTPFLTKIVEDTVLKGKDMFIEVNPKTTENLLFVREGASVVLETPKGDIPVRVHLSEGIMPGVIAVPRGLGHTAYDKYLAGKGRNFNELVGPVEDAVSGLDAAWGIRAKLTYARG